MRECCLDGLFISVSATMTITQGIRHVLNQVPQTLVPSGCNVDDRDPSYTQPRSDDNHKLFNDSTGRFGDRHTDSSRLPSGLLFR